MPTTNTAMPTEINPVEDLSRYTTTQLQVMNDHLEPELMRLCDEQGPTMTEVEKTRRATPVTIPSSLTVAQALEIISAKSAKWAATFDSATGTVECIKSDFARRTDGTIIGANSGQGFRISSCSRRPVLEVAAEIISKAEAKAKLVASQRALMEQDAMLAQARIGVLETEIADLSSTIEIITNTIVRETLQAAVTEKRQRVFDEQAFIARIHSQLGA